MKKPSLQTVVSIAEIASALAIVASLLYVAYEYRRSETVTNRDVENIIYERMLERDRLVIENPDFARALVKATDSPQDLTEVELVQLLAYEHIFYDSWESAWFYYHEGTLEPANWESWDQWFIADAKRHPRIGWIGNRQHFADSFLDHVDKALGVGEDE